MTWWLNLAAFLGIMVLAVPVWSLNLRKKKLAQIEAALPADPDSFRAQVRDILKGKRARQVAEWRRVDEVCLWLGYALLLGSAFLRLFVPTG